jgi:hypothetical protein
VETSGRLVARQLGHGGMALVNLVYGHLGTVRHRTEAVEYRVVQHKAILGDARFAEECYRCRRSRPGLSGASMGG